MILKLLVLDLLAVHAALIGMQGFIAIGEHMFSPNLSFVMSVLPPE